MTMKETRYEDVLFNPEYIKKIEQLKQDERDWQDVPDDIKEYMDAILSDDKPRFNNEIVQRVVDYLSDPMNSASYRAKVLFNPSYKQGDPEEDKPSNKWNFTIPIFSTTF